MLWVELFADLFKNGLGSQLTFIFVPIHCERRAHFDAKLVCVESVDAKKLIVTIFVTWVAVRVPNAILNVSYRDVNSIHCTFETFLSFGIISDF